MEGAGGLSAEGKAKALVDADAGGAVEFLLNFLAVFVGSWFVTMIRNGGNQRRSSRTGFG
jgi:hypothetical protein